MRVPRDGAHTGDPVYAFKKDIPDSDRASTFGVVMFVFVRPGYQDTSPTPKSSLMIQRKFIGVTQSVGTTTRMERRREK